MKRVPLVRRTPLRPRKLYRAPWRRDLADIVTPEMHAYILLRDRMCFAAMKDPAHQCRDRWGNQHAADDLARLTLDHVHRAARAGKRAESVKGCLIAMCGDANNNGWASAHRQDERDYLAEKEPE